MQHQYSFQVPDMTCKHCEATITKAVKNMDADASITVNLAHHLVIVDSNLEHAAIEAVIREAGYSPEFKS